MFFGIGWASSAAVGQHVEQLSRLQFQPGVCPHTGLWLATAVRRGRFPEGGDRGRTLPLLQLRRREHPLHFPLELVPFWAD